MAIVIAPLAAVACDVPGFGSSEGVIGVDSVRFASADSGRQVAIRVYGLIGGSGCFSLKRVERSTRGDTLGRRFISEYESNLCPQMPIPLRYEELVPNTPGRRLVYVVLGRDSVITRAATLPLP